MVDPCVSSVIQLQVDTFASCDKVCGHRRIGELIVDWRQSCINGNFASTLMHCEWKIEIVSQCRIS